MNKARWESDGRCRERKPPIIGCHKEVVERRVGVRGCGRSQSQRLVVFATTTLRARLQYDSTSESDTTGSNQPRDTE
jgi:hypothetical protein